MIPRNFLRLWTETMTQGRLDSVEFWELCWGVDDPHRKHISLGQTCIGKTSGRSFALVQAQCDRPK